MLIFRPVQKSLLAIAFICLGVAAAAQTAWPPLPKTGFISGRAANDKDVKDGNAAFVLQAYGVPFGKPLDVAIPQYAYVTKRGQPKLPAIVIQAEEGNRFKFFGVRYLDGTTASARDNEVELLGTSPP